MPENSGRIPVLECVREAWLFLATHWKLFVPAAGITAALAQLGDVIGLLSPPAEGSRPTMLDAFLRSLLLGLPAMVASVLFTAAVLRKAVRNEVIGSTGLAFGADEGRLLGVLGAMMCIILPFVGLVTVVMSTMIFSRIATTPEAMDILLADPEAMNLAIQTALGDAGFAAFMLFVLLVFVAAVYVLTRLFMVNAATTGERRIVIFQTWRWSRGNVWPMFGAVVLTGLPAVIVTNLLTEVRISMLTSMPADMGAMVPVVVSGALISFVGALISIPSTALGAILYRGLRPKDFVAK
jgi:hypothetical protein